MDAKLNAELNTELKKRSLRKSLMAPVLAAALIGGVSAPAVAATEDDPGAFTMVGDLVVARPLGIAITAVGAVAWVVALPFTALGGNVKESADELVMGPVRETFLRCLGCRMGGRYENYED